MLPESYYEACRLLEMGKSEEAALQLEAILQQYGQSCEVCNKLGVANIAMNQPDKARGCFMAAAGLNPGFAPVLVNLGNLALEQKEYDAALDYYQKALEKDASYPLAYYNRAIVYKRLGRYSEYLAEIKTYKTYYAQALKDVQKQEYQRLRNRVSFTEVVREALRKMVPKRGDIQKQKS